MEPPPQTALKWPKIQKYLYFLLIFSLFSSIRYVFTSNSAFETGAYSDFTSFSLYLSNICIVGLFLLNFRLILAKLRKHHVILGLITWVLISFILQGVRPLSLNFYFFAKFLELIILYLLFSSNQAVFSKKTLIIWFVSLGTIQSIIALFQFLSQKSLGLYLLGESHLGPNINGVAKLVSHGTKFIRGYGTFPHSNLLAAFLFAAILFSFYLLFISHQRWQKIVFSIFLAINIFGLAVSFSRAGIGATILITAFYLGWVAMAKKTSFKKLIYISSITLLAFVGAFLVFQQFLSTRATITDNAIKERVFYNQIGQKIIRAVPWQGIGFGTSVLHMQEFSPVKLESWEIQPIHNYYLLSAAEIGILGALLFILLFLWHLFKLGQQIIKNRRQLSIDDYIYKLTLLAILSGFLILMLFDHYFYTIEQTQLLLWLVLGLIMAEMSRTDTTYEV